MSYIENIMNLLENSIHVHGINYNLPYVHIVAASHHAPIMELQIYFYKLGLYGSLGTRLSLRLPKLHDYLAVFSTEASFVSPVSQGRLKKLRVRFFSYFLETHHVGMVTQQLRDHKALPIFNVQSSWIAIRVEDLAGKVTGRIVISQDVVRHHSKAVRA